MPNTGGLPCGVEDQRVGEGNGEAHAQPSHEHVEIRPIIPGHRAESAFGPMKALNTILLGLSFPRKTFQDLHHSELRDQGLGEKVGRRSVGPRPALVSRDASMSGCSPASEATHTCVVREGMHKYSMGMHAAMYASTYV